MRQLVAKFQNYRFFSLLISVLTLMIVSPFFDGAETGRLVLGLLFTLVLLSTVLAASIKRRQLVFALCLAVPWLILNWGFGGPGAGGPGAGGTEIAVNILLGIQIAFVIVLVLARILGEKEIEFDMLCGAIAVYLLLGVAWALAFSVLEQLSPGTFVVTSTSAQIDWIDLLYFSLTTLTTLGYGDITPVTPVARIWTNLEAVTGVLYIAVLVARLVSLYRS